MKYTMKIKLQMDLRLALSIAFFMQLNLHLLSFIINIQFIAISKHIPIKLLLNFTS